MRRLTLVILQTPDLRDLECSITPTAFIRPQGNCRPLSPHHSNYKFTGYDILPDYGVFDIFKNPDIPRALEDYKRHLEKHCM
jgi:hypothetical protein